ncbi:transposase [Francisella hispaniensis FSC454]|uniref:Transposase n=2 Tax=Francisella hispaniensis TaxID=622488 RepID=A0AAC9JBB8_9GAMM|nr:transposase [Francisella hispaniensis FSC454]KYW85007.1 transposase [Francisella hispaniensis FSC454]
MAKLKLIKTQVTTELNYGNGHIAKEKSQNGLYALTNISDKKVHDYSSSNILIKDNGEISLKLDDRYLGKGNIIMTPYVKSRAKTEDPYIVWDCLVTTNKKIAQSLMPEECVVKLVNK